MFSMGQRFTAKHPSKRTARVTIEATGLLSKESRHQLTGVCHEAFLVPTGGPDPLSQYYRKCEYVAVLREADRIVAFQFFRKLNVKGLPVCHFSLAASSRNAELRGAQRQMGRAILARALLRRPWAPTYLAAVCNSARSYANICVGRVRYPDVSSEGPNPFGDYYFAVAAALEIPVPDSRGIIPGRMQSLGFLVRNDPLNGHALAADYARYVGGDLNNGVFSLVRLIPVRDLPVYLMKRRSKRLAAQNAVAKRLECDPPGVGKR